MRVLGFSAPLLAALSMFAAGCGGDDGIVSIKEPDPPVGEAMLPDIAPAPPQDAHISEENGRWHIRFTTTLINVGDGPFTLRAERLVRGWEVNQDVQYSEQGAKVYKTPALLVWGGDGHDHYHVQRIAVGRLVPYEKDGKPPSASEGVSDTKIGFCYYDYARILDDAPQEVVYPRFGCGTQKDTAIGMGLSRGWADTYPFRLPGQSIDVTDLPDGQYRLWIEVDENRWFREKRRDNNVTWADLELITTADGGRDVVDVVGGPPIRADS